MANTLLIMDSRGMNFETMLQKIVCKLSPTINVKLLAIRGANLDSIENRAVHELTSHQYQQAYIMLGVNNITKLFFSKQITLAFDNIPDIVDTMDNKLTHLKLKLLTKVPKVIVCHLVGVDILMYNIEKKGSNTLLIADYPGMQKIIDEAMPLINRAIDSMNMSSNLVGPWIEDTIHSNINRKRVHKYLRLYDGLHPSPPTKKLWAKKLTKAFETNL